MSVLIKSGPQIDSEKDASRYFPAYQLEGITDDSRYQYTEKANRIGWTFLDAFKNVRLRLAQKKRDYLFTTQNWAGAVEYSRYLDHFISIYNLSKMVLSRTEETVTVKDEQGVARQEKIGIYNFDTGSRIVLFSSNPWSIQTFEGDVGWDEAAFHEQQERMYAALITRITWGFNISVWSAHNGMGSWFNQVLGKLAKAPGSGWHCRKVTIYDAIADGLVEKINERAGTTMTRDEFLADCRRRALTPAIFAERFECNPSDTGSAIVPWSVVERARTETILRHHLGDAEIKTLFGLPSASVDLRQRKMDDWMESQFGPLLGRKEKFRIGFDVAASGQGDLASLWIDNSEGKQRGLLTTQTEDWDFLTAALMWFMERLPDARGAGDSTGLGRQITWTAEQRTQGRFVGVPFNRTTKGAMGARLMNQLTAGECALAKDNDDIAMDIFALQKSVQGGNLIFTATQNPLNQASHCDMAWSKALAAEAQAGGAADALPPVPMRDRSRDFGGESEGLGRALARRVRALMG